MTSTPVVLVDCRWLASGGAGRVTELLLRGLASQDAAVRWLLWGPPEVEDLAWPGCKIVVTRHDPRELDGQREWLSVPACDLALFMHQQRPLRRMPGATFMHDTIALRFARNAVDRELKRAFLKQVARLSDSVLTNSSYSMGCLERDLGIDPARITVASPPADPDMAARVLSLRAELPPESVALFLGLFLPSKNLPRLIDAFGRTEFAAGGGRLLLMGGRPAEHRALQLRLSPAQRGYVETRPFGSQAELERALATCRLLVQPSLEEGFGLPAWEALCCGLPVCASDGGALPEITRGYARTFPATSVPQMAEAIDRTADSPVSPAEAEQRSRSFIRGSPTLAEFTKRVVQALVGPAAQ